ncbi:Voltage-gated Ion Channel (VIC) Superfamily [Thraustotheca clavata]|uniref:Voltage-gated Ion Channel (VIC) Superfamily n=1 Tax=Thraustotheca clavata TaxID=74557 RepID=A0A1V9ZZM1_9STRA|nr:Voltage-gated Ion Channel (VIC) Superfamily [Thraustotheca clavata]
MSAVTPAGCENIRSTASIAAMRKITLQRQLTERVWLGLKLESQDIAKAGKFFQLHTTMSDVAKKALNAPDDIDIFHSTSSDTSKYMIHPNSRFRRVWDVCIATFVVVVCAITPMELGFQTMDWHWLSPLETFFDVFFITDMILTFRTGIPVSGEIIMNQRLVMKHYAETWLIVDCASNFPFYLFYSHANQSSIKFLKLQKIPKMLRFARLLKYMRQYAKYFNFVLIVVAILISLHVLTCFWVSLFDECVQNVFDASTNITYCDSGQMQPMYLEALMNVAVQYFALSEYSTYAGISNLASPSTKASPSIYGLAIGIMAVGVLSISIFLANIISIFISWDQQNAMFRNRMDIISAEMKHYDIPLELQRRVKRNYDYLWINQRAYSEMTLLSQRGISKTLRTTIALFLYKDLLETVPFFAGEDAKLLGRICLVLETAVYLPGDLIIQLNDLGKEMFIVRRGVVEILIETRNSTDPRILLKDGAFFGETALVVEVRRTTSVKSVTITDLNVLNKQAFDEIIAEFPDFFAKMKRIVIQRQMDNMNITSDAERNTIEKELNAVVEQSINKRATDTTSAYWRYSEANKTGNKLKRIAERLKAQQTQSKQAAMAVVIKPKRRKKSSLKLKPRASFASSVLKASTSVTESKELPPLRQLNTQPKLTLEGLSERLEAFEAATVSLPKYLSTLQDALNKLTSQESQEKIIGPKMNIPAPEISTSPPELYQVDNDFQVKTLWERVSFLNNHPNERIDIYHQSDRRKYFLMIHPNSTLRRMWDVFMAASVIYVCVLVPVNLGFDFLDWGSTFTAFDEFMDVCFITDIVLSFRTGYYANGEIYMDYKMVARHYMQSWFIIDFISNFPLSYILPSSNKQQTSVKILKLQKMPKLLRFGVLLKYMRQYAKYYHLLLTAIIMFLSLHIFTCAWVNVFNNCYGNSTLCSDWATGSEIYTESFHNVLLTFLGIAEASEFPLSPFLSSPYDSLRAQMFHLSSIICIFGVFNCGLMFGHLLTVLLSWDQQNSTFRNRMDVISSEMKYYALPSELQHRVRRNYDYLWINQRAYADMTLLNQPGLSKPLRTTIALHLYKDLLNTVPIFAGSDSRFLGKVCMALDTAVYLPADVIIHQDDIGREMFIVRKGQVEVLKPRESSSPIHPIMMKLRSAKEVEAHRIILSDGDFFGETALVADVRRTNSVVAVTICDLNVLSKQAFNEILAEYPEFGVKMKKSVVSRQLANMNIQSPATKLKVETQLNHLVEKSLNRRKFDLPFKGIYRAKKMADKLKAIQERVQKSEANGNKGTRSSTIMRNISARKASITQMFNRRGFSLRPSPSGHHIVEQPTSVAIESPPPQLVATPSKQDIPRLVSLTSELLPIQSSIDTLHWKPELQHELLPMAIFELKKIVVDLKLTMEKFQKKFVKDKTFDSDSSYSDDGIDDSNIEEDPQPITTTKVLSNYLSTDRMPPSVIIESNEEETSKPCTSESEILFDDNSPNVQFSPGEAKPPKRISIKKRRSRKRKSDEFVSNSLEDTTQP